MSVTCFFLQVFPIQIRDEASLEPPSAFENLRAVMVGRVVILVLGREGHIHIAISTPLQFLNRTLQDTTLNGLLWGTG